MKIKTKTGEVRLINASIYIKNAILELQNVPCKCMEENVCDRCLLLSDTKNLRNSIDEEIEKMYK